MVFMEPWLWETYRDDHWGQRLINSISDECSKPTREEQRTRAYRNPVLVWFDWLTVQPIDPREKSEHGYIGAKAMLLRLPFRFLHSERATSSPTAMPTIAKISGIQNHGLRGVGVQKILSLASFEPSTPLGLLLPSLVLV